MFRNQSRLIGYLAPIALVAFLSAPQVLAQTRTVAAANAPLSLSLTADANSSAPVPTAARRKFDSRPTQFRPAVIQSSTSGRRVRA